MTPTAAQLLADLRHNRKSMYPESDEETTFVRQLFDAKRDTYDIVIRMVERAIPEIENEASFGISEESEPAAA